MFATTFHLEHEPMSASEVVGAFKIWVLNAGAIAAVGLLIWVIAWLVQHKKKDEAIRENLFVVICIALSFTLYLVMGFIFVFYLLGASNFEDWLPNFGAPGLPHTLGDTLLLSAGAMALVAINVRIVMTFLTGIRWQRIWAMARVSLKEAIRNRVVLVFAAMALIFLFADWFVPYKAEDQVRNYVRVVYWSMLPLFLLTASLLGAFSIPNDVKNQSIHTIVTKPVEKFEIVLGRFLGYAILLSGGLAVVGGLSLIYVLRGVNPEAEYESKKARVPIYGNVGFIGTKGESVGREWNYRKYIGGPQGPQVNQPKQYAIWAFPDLPTELGERETGVKFEFTFDIFRLNKGEENKGIFCTFTFSDTRRNVGDIERAAELHRRERTQELANLARKPLSPEEREKAFDKIEKELIKKHGVVEVSGFEVTDYHTQVMEVPAVFFTRLNDLVKADPGEGPDAGKVSMYVLVNVDRTSPQQMLGVARRDLYLLANERPFAINFIKGLVGMWSSCMLVLGIAIACSTYLSGVISWLCTLFLFGAGVFREQIMQLAEGRSVGGGPLESAYRIITHSPLASPIEPGPTTSLLLGVDTFYGWLMRLVVKLIPDVNRYDLHQYVANGFDIPWIQVLLLDNFLYLAAYLIPWAILAFYLMKFREIANPT